MGQPKGWEPRFSCGLPLRAVIVQKLTPFSLGTFALHWQYCYACLKPLGCCKHRPAWIMPSVKKKNFHSQLHQYKSSNDDWSFASVLLTDIGSLSPAWLWLRHGFQQCCAANIAFLPVLTLLNLYWFGRVGAESTKCTFSIFSPHPILAAFGEGFWSPL